MTTKYRGAQISNAPSIVDIQALNDMDANIIRFQFMGDLFNESRAELIKVLEHTNKKVIIALMRGAFNYVDNRPAAHEFWKKIITEFDSNPKVFGYDLLNEPAGTADDVKIYMRRISLGVLEQTAKKVIVTNVHGDPTRFTSCYFSPKCWHTLHMYLPMALTHQGIGLRKYPVNYPSPKMNKENLKNFLSKARAFQQKNRARMYVGEFGISKFASPESRKAYLKDCISIFEEYGWHWSYHAFREADVWDLEADGTIEVMKKAWEKNA